MLRSLQVKIAFLGLFLLVPLGVTLALFFVSQATQNQQLADNVGVFLQRHVQLSFLLLIVAPTLALVLNIGPFLLRRAAHILNVLIALAALGGILFVFGHDAIPCFLHRLSDLRPDNLLFTIRDCIENS